MPIEKIMSEAEYVALDGLRISTVKAVLASPAKWNYEQKHPKNEKHFTIGSAVHSMVLEGGENVVHIDVDDWKTKAARAARDEALEAGQYPLNNTEHAQAVAMADRLRCIPDVSVRLDDPNVKREAVITGTDRSTFAAMKVRIDMLDVETRTIIDLKTCADADPMNFGTTAWRHGYHLQAAHNIDMAAQATNTKPSQWRFLFALVEKSAPHETSLVELDDAAIDLGRRERTKGIMRYLDCVERDTWPGYPQTVQPVRLPKYAYGL